MNVATSEKKLVSREERVEHAKDLKPGDSTFVVLPTGAIYEGVVALRREPTEGYMRSAGHTECAGEPGEIVVEVAGSPYPHLKTEKTMMVFDIWGMRQWGAPAHYAYLLPITPESKEMARRKTLVEQNRRSLWSVIEGGTREKLELMSEKTLKDIKDRLDQIATLMGRKQ